MRLFVLLIGDDGHAPRQVLLRLVADVPVRPLRTQGLLPVSATGGKQCFASRSNWVEPAADFDAYYGVSQPRQVYTDNLTTASVSPLYLIPAAAALWHCGAAVQPLRVIGVIDCSQRSPLPVRVFRQYAAG